MLEWLRGWLATRGHVYRAATVILDLGGFTLERERAPAVRVCWADLHGVRVMASAEPGVPSICVHLRLRRGRVVDVFSHWEGFDAFTPVLGRELGRPADWWTIAEDKIGHGLEVDIVAPHVRR